MHTKIAHTCATSHLVSLSSLLQACICKGAEQLDSGAHITKTCNSKHTNQTNANATHPQQRKAQQRNALHQACKSKGLDSIIR